MYEIENLYMHSVGDLQSTNEHSCNIWIQCRSQNGNGWKDFSDCFFLLLIVRQYYLRSYKNLQFKEKSIKNVQFQSMYRSLQAMHYVETVVFRRWQCLGNIKWLKRVSEM